MTDTINTAHVHVRNTLRRISQAVAALQARGSQVPEDARRSLDELQTADQLLTTYAIDAARPPQPAAVITFTEDTRVPGKVADAEITFCAGILSGMKLIGFAIWERRTAAGLNVTFPARQYAVNGERRSFALLRPTTLPTAGLSTAAQEGIRQMLITAYQRRAATADTVWSIAIDAAGQPIARQDTPQAATQDATPAAAQDATTTTAPDQDPPLQARAQDAPALQVTPDRPVLDLDAMTQAAGLRASTITTPAQAICATADAIAQAVYGTPGPMPPRPRRF